LAEAVIFLFGALAIGTLVSPRLFRLVSRLPGTGALLTTALVCCFALASLASTIGLAPIVGAYAAGLILEETHYREFTERGEHRLEELVRPISILLVPLFFVLMGMRVDLHAFARPGAIGLAALLTVAAIVGKQVCALGGLGSTLDKITIGIGMIPRGEVGLIFANIGLGLVVHGERIVDDHIYSAVVIAVMVTTLVTPPALKWRLSRTSRSVQSV
jgi:Kef-type K+ transport system membrane component KefB